MKLFWIPMLLLPTLCTAGESFIQINGPATTYTMDVEPDFIEYGSTVLTSTITQDLTDRVHVSVVYRDSIAHTKPTMRVSLGLSF